MSLKTALQKIVTEFNSQMNTAVYGIMDNEGVPENAISGIYPATYLEQGDTHREYGSLLPIEPTSIYNDAYLMHLFHIDSVSTGTMKDEAMRREQLIVDFIQDNTASREWEDDGDQGFGIVPVTTIWYISPQSEVSGFRIQLRLFAYGP